MSEHQLYVISEGFYGPIKIGHSRNAWARLSALQTGNPRSLCVALVYAMPRDEAIAAERMLHEELQRHQLDGEWFNLDEQFMLSYMPDFFLANGFEAEVRK